MGCEECENNPKEYPFRLGTATISIISCEKHFMIAREKLLRGN